MDHLASTHCETNSRMESVWISLTTTFAACMFSILKDNSMRSKIVNLLLLSLCLPVAGYSGQTSSPAGPAPKGGVTPPSSSSPASTNDATSALGFSIETEMFTYRAEAENSDEIACDIGRYLSRSGVGGATTEPRCSGQALQGPAIGIMIISSESNVLSNFQIWRSDIATMNNLAMRAAKVCTAMPAPTGPVAAGGRGLLDVTPEGQALSMLQSAIGMFASNQSASAVVGTVKDQALMDEVAGKLRAWNISVMIPETYNPFELGGADPQNSIYFSNLDRLIDYWRTCQAYKNGNPNMPPDQMNQVDAVIAGIDAFKKSAIPPELVQASAAPKPATPSASVTPQSGSVASTPPPASPGPTNANGSTAQSSPSSASHFQAILQIDGLARALGFEGDGSKGPSPTWQHILWVKALESGGTVFKEGNIFGTKLRFSGGAVATYALFSIDGKLDCSGNVYNFQDAVRSKEVPKIIAAPRSRPESETSGVHSTCGQ